MTNLHCLTQMFRNIVYSQDSNLNLMGSGLLIELYFSINLQAMRFTIKLSILAATNIRKPIQFVAIRSCSYFSVHHKTKKRELLVLIFGYNLKTKVVEKNLKVVIQGKMKNSVKKIVLTKTGKPNKSVQNMLHNCNFSLGEKMLGTGYYSGAGRFTTRHSAFAVVKSLLDAGGYKYNFLNDGGAVMEHFSISKKGYYFLKSIKELKDEKSK